MFCKNLSKSIDGRLKCKLNKQVITLSECKNCSNRILVKNKGIKKISSHRKNVSKETYEKVYERDKGSCRICGSRNIQLHHIVYRSENKNLINESSNCIMLCLKCHNLVHSNKKYWQKKLKEIVEKRR